MAREAEGDVSAENGADGGHGGIIGPVLFVVGREEDGERVHAAGDGDDGAVNESEDDEARAAEVVEPSPDSVSGGRSNGGDESREKHRCHARMKCNRRERGSGVHFEVNHVRLD